MTAGTIISDTSYAVSPADTAALVLERMTELKTSQLPVVKDHLYSGLVYEEDLLDVPGSERLLDAELVYRPVLIHQEQHVYDALRLFNMHQTDILPVLDQQNYYLGCISLLDLMKALSAMTAADLPGGIIVLEIGSHDNALSHMAKIVESANAQVLSSYVRAFPDSTKLEVTLKVNRMEISDIVAAFLRYDYTIINTYNDIREYDTTRDRYDHLMHYLNI